MEYVNYSLEDRMPIKPVMFLGGKEHRHVSRKGFAPSEYEGCAFFLFDVDLNNIDTINLKSEGIKDSGCNVPPLFMKKSEEYV